MAAHGDRVRIKNPAHSRNGERAVVVQTNGNIYGRRRAVLVAMGETLADVQGHLAIEVFEDEIELIERDPAVAEAEEAERAASRVAALAEAITTLGAETAEEEDDAEEGEGGEEEEEEAASDSSEDASGGAGDDGDAEADREAVAPAASATRRRR
jgi:hypothetical protein